MILENNDKIVIFFDVKYKTLEEGAQLQGSYPMFSSKKRPCINCKALIFLVLSSPSDPATGEIVW